MADSPARNWSQLRKSSPLKARVRGRVRDALIWMLSLKSRPPRSSNWIRFPYYHHVFDDERRGFERQLRYMRGFGEFVSLDDALGLIEQEGELDGRYFCITFDDGFRNNLSNAVPILLDHAAPAAFFVPTAFIGVPADDVEEQGVGRIHQFGGTAIEFLDWDEVRELAAVDGMSVGSHTVSHQRLSDLEDDAVEYELRASKEKIERELGARCDHFCAPVGRPGLDFDPERDPELAMRAGYRSFLTTRRGSHGRRPIPEFVERDHLIAAWGVYQLRYFLGR